MALARPIFFFLIFSHLCIGIASNTVSYAGMEIECPYDCGELDADSNMDEIEKIFSRTIESTLSPCLVLDGSLEAAFVHPWQDSSPSYSVWDWKAAGGIWKDDRDFEEYSILTYPEFQKTAQALREDLAFYYTQAPRLELNKCRALVSKLKAADQREYGNIDVYNEELELYDWGTTTSSSKEITHAIDWVKYRIQQAEKYLPDSEFEYEKKKEEAEKALAEIDSLFKHIFVWCLQHHQPEGIAFHSALEQFLAQDYEAAIGQLRFLTDLAEEHNLGNQLLSKLYLLQGQLQSEVLLFSGAIIDLTKAIQKDPSLKEAYFERAAAYFELGDFDRALSDYLESGLKPSPLLLSDLCSGIALGVLDGGADSLTEFVPELLGTLRGLAKGLWACASSPLQATQELASSAVQCVQLLKEHSPFELIQEMLPELKELLQNFDHLPDQEKGKQIGRIIGKYGTDVFLCKTSFTAIKAYRNLKRANQLMTLEALASPKESQIILQEAGKRWAQREQSFKNSLKIEWDKQNKHITSAKNFESNKPRSIWIHGDPNSLLAKYSGKGRKIIGEFGTPGFKEKVNFGEVIGYYVDQSTGAKTETSWGIIHYSKKGAHIVPDLGDKY